MHFVLIYIFLDLINARKKEHTESNLTVYLLKGQKPNLMQHPK